MQLFQSLWGWDGSLEAASDRAANQGFDGLECNVAHACLQPLPPDEVRRNESNGSSPSSFSTRRRQAS